MSNYKLTREEQETHIWGNAGSQDFEIYSADPRDIRRMDRLGYTVVEEDQFGKRYRVPRHAISFRRVERKKRILSEERRESLRRNLVKAVSTRRSPNPIGNSEGQSDLGMVG